MTMTIKTTPFCHTQLAAALALGLTALPAVAQQTFADGVLQITVVEGRYGKISATGDARLAPAEQGFLAVLVPGSVIDSAGLERTTLILSDQPGLRTAPIVRPDQEVGTGDLVVQVSPTPAVKGELGLDNHGNRYTGEYRARANLQWDSPFLVSSSLLASLALAGFAHAQQPALPNNASLLAPKPGFAAPGQPALPDRPLDANPLKPPSRALVTRRVQSTIYNSIASATRRRCRCLSHPPRFGLARRLSCASPQSARQKRPCRSISTAMHRAIARAGLVRPWWLF